MQDPRIILVAETGGDIPREVAEQYNIQLVPMHVAFGTDTRDDGTFPSEEVCDFYDRTGILCKTSGSVPEDFTKCFDHIHTRWPQAQILYLAYSSVTTCSYQSAQIAAEDRDYVTALDTKAVSAGQYSIVIETAKWLEAHPEATIQEAAQVAQDLISRANMCFVPKDMEYLRAGGRVSNVVALGGKLLGILPLIEILEGKLVATRKLRGKLEALAPKLVREYAEKWSLDRKELWLIWTPRFPDDLKQVVEKTAKDLGFETVTWVKSGGVITSHSGPSAFGVVGFTKA